MIAQLDMFA
jgi:hypothetical protein